MIYTIVYKEEDQMFHMNGKEEMFIGTHLENIGKNLFIKDLEACYSESEALACLALNGVTVNLLEEDGSRMEW